jgi:hypothetical protein
MRIHARPTIAALATLTLLAACGSEPEAPPEPAPAETAEPAPVAPAPPPPPPPVENVAEEAPVVELEPDQQVLEDADATGMTARVERGEVPAEDAGQAVAE